MNYTKKQINDLVKKLLKDIKRPYFEHMPFNIEFENNIIGYDLKEKVKNVWKTVVFVQEDQFPDKGDYSIIIIIINDENGHIETYSDRSCGRPVPMKAELKNGKYRLVSL